MPKTRSAGGHALRRMVGFFWGGLFAVFLVGLEAGCVNPVPSTTPILSEPPREVIDATMVHDRLEIADTLDFELSDGSTAAIHERITVLPDGSVELTGCGRVQVAGKTLEEAREILRQQVAAARQLTSAVVQLHFAQCYVVTESASGERHIERYPVDSAPTVRDLLTDMEDAEHKVVWVVRPSPAGSIGQQMLAVDWDLVRRGQDDATNYKIRPGDWVFALNEPAEGFGRFMGALTSMVRENP